MRKITRRRVLAGAAAVAASALTPFKAFAQRRLILDDASGLSATPVFSHWVAKSEGEAELIARLRSELKEAAAQKRPVCVGAARHSMGGQSLPRNGTAIEFDINRCEPDRAAKTFRVNAGTRWFEVIEHLDKIGFSPAVMQSNSDFGVAATFSVNAHGWPTPYGPFGSTVRSFRMMMADGSIVTCSRKENSELFSLMMGGYGMFGIILDLEVDMVENLLVRPSHEAMPAEEFSKRFVAAIEQDPNVKMAYGRLNVSKKTFFNEALLITYRPEPVQPDPLPASTRGTGAMANFANRIYRGQVGSEDIKGLRWYLETTANPAISSGVSTRSGLMNWPVSNLRQLDYRRTDILHEYFVAPERFNEFLKGCREIIPKGRAEFLNVTLRYVLQDDTSTLSFAKTNRIASVMSFSQELTAAGEADMIRTTEALIDLVASIGGSFYLPYRLHARADQVRKIYPNTERFIERKRHYDPGLLFRNNMWDTYFAA